MVRDPGGVLIMSCWWPCCCDCKTVHDREMEDASATESYEIYHSVSVTQSASQTSSDGSTMKCSDAATAAKPPCRELLMNGSREDPLLDWGLFYWRLYAQAVWTPDGSDVTINGRIDSKYSHFTNSGGSELAPAYGPLVYIGAKQGSTYGLWFPSNPIYSNLNGDDFWRRHRYVGLTLATAGWAQFDATTPLSIGTPTWTPDTTLGADDITFGIAIREANSESITSIERTALLDNVCMSLVPG